MKILEAGLNGLLIIEPDIYKDHRGYFLETWNRDRYYEVGIEVDFLQDNLSFSKYGILRGLHFQNPNGQGKLVYVLHGEVFDVAIDIRVGSPTFGKWKSVVLSSDNKRQLYIPEGFAHGFCVISQTALFAYKCTEFYKPEAEAGIIWNDSEIGIKWPLEKPMLSEKDLVLPHLKDIGDEALPVYV